MLVLSRRESEKILIPSIDLTMEILRVKEKVVRVGIEAPPAVRILREEVVDPHLVVTAAPELNPLSLNKRLKTINLSLHILRRLIDMGSMKSADETLDTLIAMMEQLHRDLDSGMDADRPDLAAAILGADGREAGETIRRTLTAPPSQN